MSKQRNNWAYAGVFLLSLVDTNIAVAGGVLAPHPFAEPSPAYLEQFIEPNKRMLVIERYDAKGSLQSREIKALTSPIRVTTATDRQFGDLHITLRGLVSCPRKTVIYNRVQKWNCEEAADDHMGGIYNERAAVILCKTFLLQPTPGKPEPASCFALVGDGARDPYSVAYDDDTMVFFGLADIAISQDGTPRRPDLIESQGLSRSMGFDDVEQ